MKEGYGYVDNSALRGTIAPWPMDNSWTTEVLTKSYPQARDFDHITTAPNNKFLYRVTLFITELQSGLLSGLLEKRVVTAGLLSP